jgi:hypothetical protein
MTVPKWNKYLFKVRRIGAIFASYEVAGPPRARRRKRKMGRAKPLVASHHLDAARPLAVLAVVAFCGVFWVAVAVVATLTARALHIH